MSTYLQYENILVFAETNVSSVSFGFISATFCFSAVMDTDLTALQSKHDSLTETSSPLFASSKQAHMQQRKARTCASGVWVLPELIQEGHGSWPAPVEPTWVPKASGWWAIWEGFWNWSWLRSSWWGLVRSHYSRIRCWFCPWDFMLLTSLMFQKKCCEVFLEIVALCCTPRAMLLQLATETAASHWQGWDVVKQKQILNFLRAAFLSLPSDLEKRQVGLEHSASSLSLLTISVSNFCQISVVH